MRLFKLVQWNGDEVQRTEYYEKQSNASKRALAIGEQIKSAGYLVDDKRELQLTYHDLDGWLQVVDIFNYGKHQYRIQVSEIKTTD